MFIRGLDEVAMKVLVHTTQINCTSVQCMASIENNR